jgi:hypothetical protein
MLPTSGPNRKPRKDGGTGSSEPNDAKVVPLTPRIRESTGPVCPPTGTEDSDPGPSAA